MKMTIVSDNRVLAEQFHMKSGSYSSCQLFFPFILLIIIPSGCQPSLLQIIGVYIGIFSKKYRRFYLILRKKI